MSFTPPKMGRSPTVKRDALKNWLKGTVTAFDSGRTPTDGLLSASNVMLYQDGTVGPRPSLREYGPQPLGKVLGEVGEFKTLSGLKSNTKMISVQVVNGVGGLYVAAGEDSQWTRVGDTTFNVNASAHFLQIQNKVVVVNGEDNLTYYDTAANTITRVQQITKPASPSLKAKTGLDGTAFSVYYAVTANSTVGETDADTALKVPILIDRDSWNADTMSVEIQWTAVTGAKSYNVYMGVSADGAGQPTLYAIATGLDASTLTFKDNGTKAQDLYKPIPKHNGTAGPRATRGDIINGRIWLVGDKDNPYLVWRGGDYNYELDFSPANGGGSTPIGNGTKEVPNTVKAFRTGKGDQSVMVLTQSTNGSGRRFFLSQQQMTYGSTSFIYWRVDEDSGTDGTDSPDGVLVYNNSYFYPSRDGFKTTGTKPQLQNVLSMDRISNTIQDDISRLNTQTMDKCVGLAYEGRLHWALPVDADRNTEIWTLDLDRGGAWMKPWSIRADWLWLYNDNSGNTHFCVLQDNKIYEFAKNQFTNDNGVPFNTDITSGQNYFSEDEREWAKVLVVVFSLARPQGQINFSVTGMTDEGPATYTISKFYGIETSVAGWGEPSLIGIEGFGQFAWSEIGDVPESTGLAKRDEILEIDDEFIWWSYQLASTGSNVNYQLLTVVPEYVQIGTKDLE